MNNNLFLSSVLAAAFLSLGAGAMMTTFCLVMVPADAIRALILIVGIAYACWLQRWLVIHFGLSLLLVGGALLAGLLVIFNPGIFIWMASISAFWCLLRSTGRYKRPGAVFADAILSAASLIAAIAIFQHTGSIALSAWGLFLTLAFCSFIPAKESRLPLVANNEDEKFSQAYRAAAEALNRLGNAKS